MRRTATVVLPAALSLAVLAACSSSSSSSSSASTSAGAAKASAKVVEVSLTDEGCDPNSLSASAGPTTFKVTNNGSAGVTEFEVLDGDRILGEVENVAPGLDRSFSLTLKPGTYTTKCTGGSKEKGTLAVAESGQGTSSDPSARDSAVKTYLDYVSAEAATLVTSTQAFVDAVKAGDVAKAKSLFAPARVHYEAIEPIAESFGDLDPDIDARDGDVPADQWGGFHRIEQALWVNNSTAGMTPVADALLADVNKLQSLIPTLQLEPSQVANGAVGLLNEVSASKVTGEEDRYSHTDLADFAANLAGSKAAFDAVKSLLPASDSDLVTTIDQRFADVQQALDAHKDPNAIAAGYALYTTLTPDQVRDLSTKVDALAEPLSQVAAAVLQ